MPPKLHHFTTPKGPKTPFIFSLFRRTTTETTSKRPPESTKSPLVFSPFSGEIVTGSSSRQQPNNPISCLSFHRCYQLVLTLSDQPKPRRNPAKPKDPPPFSNYQTLPAIFSLSIYEPKLAETAPKLRTRIPPLFPIFPDQSSFKLRRTTDHQRLVPFPSSPSRFSFAF
uniref:Transposon protein, unclassified n=1 Tax=Solanum tuberosum TaxID=4113 RepID=M1BDW0_SOLTU